MQQTLPDHWALELDRAFSRRATDDGFTPNFGKLKDDLDVPAFLRKQMD